MNALGWHLRIARPALARTSFATFLIWPDGKLTRWISIVIPKVLLLTATKNYEVPIQLQEA